MPIASYAVSGGMVCPWLGGQHLQERARDPAQSLHHIVRAERQQPFSGDQHHDSVSGVSFLSQESRTRGCVPGTLHGPATLWGEETHLATMSSTDCFMTIAKGQPNDGLAVRGEASGEALWRWRANGFSVVLCGQGPLSLPVLVLSVLSCSPG